MRRFVWFTDTISILLVNSSGSKIPKNLWSKSGPIRQFERLCFSYLYFKAEWGFFAIVSCSFVKRSLENAIKKYAGFRYLFSHNFFHNFSSIVAIYFRKTRKLLFYLIILKILNYFKMVISYGKCMIPSKMILFQKRNPYIIVHVK